VDIGSQLGGPDGPGGSWCTSDTIVWGEALASLAISLGVLGAAARWWPVNADHHEEEPLGIGQVPLDLT